jgi:single-strand DNA-binding protein
MTRSLLKLMSGWWGNDDEVEFELEGGVPKMRSLNKVMLIGHLGADPELRHTPAGRPVATIRLATTEVWGGRDGAPQQEHTEWHRVIAWGRLGEICNEYLRKGRQVYFEGRIQTRQWQDQQGNKRFSTEIIAQNMVMLGGRGEGGAPGAGGPSSSAGSAPRAGRPDWQGAPEPDGVDMADPGAGDFVEEDNDLPF